MKSTVGKLSYKNHTYDFINPVSVGAPLHSACGCSIAFRVWGGFPTAVKKIFCLKCVSDL